MEQQQQQQQQQKLFDGGGADGAPPEADDRRLPQQLQHQPSAASDHGPLVRPPGRDRGQSLLKRVARACVACRKGKNRCDGLHPCARCTSAGLECVFEKPQPKKRRPSTAGEDGDGAGVGPGAFAVDGGRVDRLEASMQEMSTVQSGMQSMLEAILAQLGGGAAHRGGGTASSAGMSQQDSHISPASSSSQAPSHNSLSIQPSQLSLSASQQQHQQNHSHHPQSLALPLPPQQQTLLSATSAFSTLGFSPSSAAGLSLAAGIPTSAYSPINLANGGGFPANFFSAGPGGTTGSSSATGLGAGASAFSPTPLINPAVGEAAAAALASFDDAFGRVSDIRGGGSSGGGGGGGGGGASSGDPNHSTDDHPWLSDVASSSSAAHRSQHESSMPPPPLPDHHLARRSGQGAHDAGYRADTEDAYALSSDGRTGGAVKRPPSPGEGSSADAGKQQRKKKKFPALPGYAPPETHQFAPYEIVPSTAVSSEDEEDETLPRATLAAPSLALEGLANAAAAAADGTLSPPRALRMRRRKRAPAPPIFFPDVVTKELVSEVEARELYDLFFRGCEVFVPLFDRTYDTFDDLRVRTPFTLNGMLAIAAKVRAGPNPPGEVFRLCLAEAQGIARSTLFGPVVQKEAVQALLLLATHSQNSYLPSGHALRAGLDFGLHRALDKLVQGHPGGRSEAEERDLVVSSRIWLCIFWFDRLNGLGNGRPILLRDDESVLQARKLLEHPMSSRTDVRLVAMLELVQLRTSAYDRVQKLKTEPLEHTLLYLRDVDGHLNSWYDEWEAHHRMYFDDGSVARKMLLAELDYARLYVNCLALRGVSWDRMPLEQRNLALKAKDAATRCLDVFLSAPIRHALCFATHEQLVMATFSACYLLKVAILFPDEVAPRPVLSQVQALADLLSEISAERYALTLRLMLSSFRRKFTITQPSTPRINPLLDGQTANANSLSHLLQPSPAGATLAVPGAGTGVGGQQTGFSWDDFPSFDWPDAPDFSPDIVPDWLRENSLTDLGLPAAGSDSIFIPFDLQHVVSDSPWGFALDSAGYGAAW